MTKVFELEKEEASSLICITHLTYCCLTSRLSSYFIQPFNVPLEGVARFTFLCKLIVFAAAASPAVRSTLERYGAPTRRDIARRQEHCGVVLWGTNTAFSSPAVIALWSSMRQQHCFDTAHCHSSGAQYGAPKRLQHCQQSSHCDVVLWSTNAALSSPAVVTQRSCTMGHRHCKQLLHWGTVWGTNAVWTLPAVVTLWSCTMGHQRGFDIASSHCTGAWYRAPMLLQHC